MRRRWMYSISVNVMQIGPKRAASLWVKSCWKVFTHSYSIILILCLRRWIRATTTPYTWAHAAAVNFLARNVLSCLMVVEVSSGRTNGNWIRDLSRKPEFSHREIRMLFIVESSSLSWKLTWVVWEFLQSDFPSPPAYYRLTFFLGLISFPSAERRKPQILPLHVGDERGAFFGIFQGS